MADDQDGTQVAHPSALPEDNGTPAQPPITDDDQIFGDAHPATDNQTNIDDHEIYDEGKAEATADNPPDETI